MADDDVAALRAVAHPVRLRILSLLTGAEMSAAEVARELDLTHANASYHLRVLAQAGEVVVAGEEKIRGGVAKRYRHPWDHARGRRDAGRPEDQRGREQAARAMADEMVRRLAERRPRTRAELVDAELWVSAEAWARARALVKEAAELLHAQAQPPRTAQARHVNMTSAMFEMRR